MQAIRESFCSVRFVMYVFSICLADGFQYESFSYLRTFGFAAGIWRLRKFPTGLFRPEIRKVYRLLECKVCNAFSDRLYYNILVTVTRYYYCG